MLLLLFVSCQSAQYPISEKAVEEPVSSETSFQDPLSVRVGEKIPPRSVKDPAQYVNLFKMARSYYKQSKYRVGTEKLDVYLRERPQGQFADKAYLLRGRYLQSIHDYVAAADSYKKIMELSPVSPYRSLAVMRLSQVYHSQGNNVQALKQLARVETVMLSKNQQAELYSFWAKLAMSESRHLEASLAFLKANKVIKGGAAFQKNRKQVSKLVENHLREAELEFLKREYPDSFPVDVVCYRLAGIRLAQGKKESARALLNQTITWGGYSSPYSAKAQQLMSRLDRLGDSLNRRVGLLLPLSGASAVFGTAIKNGFNMGLERNKIQDIEVIVADAGSDVSSVSKALEKLIFDDKVSVVVGPLSGSQSEKVAQMTTEYGVPYLVLSSRPGLKDYGSSVFQFPISPYKQVHSLIRYARDQGAKGFAILFPEDNFGKEFAAAFFLAAKELGVSVNAAESYSPKQSDFRVQVQNMVLTADNSLRREEYKKRLADYKKKVGGRKLNPKELSHLQELPPIIDFEAIFLPDSYRALGQIIPALRFEKIKNVTLLGPSTWRNKRLIERAGQYIGKNYIADSFASSRPLPHVQSFMEDYRRRFGGKNPGKLEALGHDVALAIIKAYRRGGLNPQNRSDWSERFLSLGEFSGVLGRQLWDSSREVLRDVHLYSIKNSRFEYQLSMSQ